LAAIKTGATPPGVFQVPGYGGASISNYGNCPGSTGCAVGFDQIIQVTTAVGGAYPFGSLPSGWSNQGVVAGSDTSWTWQAIHRASSPSTLGALPPGSVPTAEQINAWLSTLPSNDPLSLPSHTQVAGVGAQPQSADQIMTQPVEATSVTTQVVPATQVGPTDVVVNPNAPPPAGPLPVQTGTQNTTSTTTTTTTTNPNGSTTTATTETETAPVQCNAGNHEPRTFGGILQDHMDLWKGSGLLSALNLLKTLTWPTAIPTYSLQSTLLGTFTLDFSAWSGMLTAIRSIIIAIAGFVAYKIIFVGAR